MIVAELLVGELRRLGVPRLFGRVPPVLADAAARVGMAVVEVADPDLAVLLADADGRIGEVDGRGRLGAAVLEGAIVHLSSEPGGMCPLRTVRTVDELAAALADPPGIELPAASAVHLDLDLAEPLGDERAAQGRRAGEALLTLSPSMADLRLGVVAGPGVVRTGAVGELAELARTLGAGILNTWGAKGVQRWDSPWHFGTFGLQADDVELAGLTGFDVVVATGVDPAELPGATLGHGVVQEVSPAQLAVVCRDWPTTGSREPGARPPLFDAIASVVRPLYESASVPLHPARAALHLSGALPDGGMAVVDPGVAGLWVARSFPTSIPNSVCVPATVAAGFAAAAGLCCALDGRPVLAVTDEAGAAEHATAQLLELAAALGAPFGLQVWVDRDGPGWTSTDDHVALLAEHLGTDEVRVDRVPVVTGDTALLEAVAGPVVAWTGDAGN